MATKEQVYIEQLTALGIYSPAFDGAIHTLCILERELSRTMKAWKATAADKNKPPAVTDPLYSAILQQRREILTYRDALGLTPKGLQRLKGKQREDSAAKSRTDISSKLDALCERVKAYDK
nr:MAG TPA: terminase small subunit [Caudoviricetes sp.]